MFSSSCYHAFGPQYLSARKSSSESGTVCRSGFLYMNIGVYIKIYNIYIYIYILTYIHTHVHIWDHLRPRAAAKTSLLAGCTASPFVRQLQLWQDGQRTPGSLQHVCRCQELLPRSCATAYGCNPGRSLQQACFWSVYGM